MIQFKVDLYHSKYMNEQACVIIINQQFLLTVNFISLAVPLLHLPMALARAKC